MNNLKHQSGWNSCKAGKISPLQVAFESANEQNAVGRFMNSGNVREVWTSGRLCDKEVDGCEADRYSSHLI